MTEPNVGAPSHGVGEIVVERPGTVPPASVNGDVAILQPRGEFDMANQREFGEAIHHAVISGNRLVVVDFSEVEFIDASVIRMLLHSQQLAESRGCRLNLVNVTSVPELILRALQIGPPLWDDPAPEQAVAG